MGLLLLEKTGNKIISANRGCEIKVRKIKYRRVGDIIKAEGVSGGSENKGISGNKGVIVI